MAWGLGGNIRGPTGPTGPTGLQGLQGPAGTGFVATDVLVAPVARTLITAGDVTGLEHAIAVNQRLMFRGSLLYTAAAATTGLGLGVNGPAGATVAARVQIAETATTVRNGIITTLDGNVQALASAAATPMFALIEGSMLAGATAGTLALRLRSEIAGSAVTILAGSFLTLWTG